MGYVNEGAQKWAGGPLAVTEESEGYGRGGAFEVPEERRVRTRKGVTKQP